MTTYYTAADLAEEFSITRRAIRFYEMKGLLQSERRGRFMYYDYRQRARLIIILRSKRLGISLASAKHYLALYDDKPDSPPRMLYMLHQSRTRLDELREQQLALQENIAELELLESIAMKDLTACDIDIESSYQAYLGELTHQDKLEPIE
ncbi:putative transcriptional regulator LiuR of leucine degradation pathway, MerR family [Moritella sp. JT01]|uniref:MerR family DNA-binding protein n=1 Tax=Moritella sp. JT01 TaxID=756698 RepID=UPI00079AA410|nr:MerR family DNA-binding protein [Moritella sp. JT01]KXO06979.1 putative transcriptional regulator LiuR of leucine degradation pathway, MerR family [Moritella sp. JT01]